MTCALKKLHAQWSADAARRRQITVSTTAAETRSWNAASTPTNFSRSRRREPDHPMFRVSTLLPSSSRSPIKRYQAAPVETPRRGRTDLGHQHRRRGSSRGGEHDGLLLVSSMGKRSSRSTRQTVTKISRETGGRSFRRATSMTKASPLRSADRFVYAVDAATRKTEVEEELGAVLAGPNVAQGVLCVGTHRHVPAGALTAPFSGLCKVRHVPEPDRHAGTSSSAQPLPLHRPRKPACRNGTWSSAEATVQELQRFAPAITAPAVGNGKVFVSTNDAASARPRIEDGHEAGNRLEEHGLLQRSCMRPGLRHQRQRQSLLSTPKQRRFHLAGGHRLGDLRFRVSASARQGVATSSSASRDPTARNPPRSGARRRQILCWQYRAGLAGIFVCRGGRMKKSSYTAP